MKTNETRHPVGIASARRWDDVDLAFVVFDDGAVFGYTPYDEDEIVLSPIPASAAHDQECGRLTDDPSAEVRIPVAIAIEGDPNALKPVVACSDGTIWYYDLGGDKWQLRATPPGTKYAINDLEHVVVYGGTSYKPSHDPRPAQ